MKLKNIVCSIAILMMASFMIMGNTMLVNATDRRSLSGNATGDEKTRYQNEISNYVSNLKTSNTLTTVASSKLDTIAANARAYIWNNQMTASDISAYISDIKGQLDAVVKNQHEGEPTTANEFLAVTDNVATPTAKYGKQVNVILSIINLSNVPLTNLVITPVVDTSVNKWPFELSTTGYTKQIASIPGSNNYDEAVKGRQELTYTFTTRDDVLSGYYKLEFDVTYNRNGSIETTKLSSYVKAEGAPGSGTVDSSGEGDASSSKPRVIVTGFETNPKDVYAGDTFTVTIHLENTSKRTAINNMQIDLQATPEGTTDNKYEAFLPTSGSNTVYIDKVAAGGKADIEIEMTAKADLTQKPYVLEVNMEYEDAKYKTFSSKASVSIPIKQASKLDSSTPEIMPESVTIGSQANVMFNIYNVGKTTLYNVQVKFKGDSIDGGDTFVGKVEPGATGAVDTMLTGKAPTMDDGTITAVISYEDDAGNVTEVEKTMTLFVSEDMGGMDVVGPEEMLPEPQKGFPVWAIVLIVALVIVAGVVAFILIKKKKKAAKELAEDLEDIDELGENEVDNNSEADVVQEDQSKDLESKIIMETNKEDK